MKSARGCSLFGHDVQQAAPRGMPFSDAREQGFSRDLPAAQARFLAVSLPAPASRRARSTISST